MSQTPPDESEITNPTEIEGEVIAREPVMDDAATRAQFESDLKFTQRALAAQEKVTIKVREDTYVGINGYGFQIQANTKVRVPQQVADILEESGRI